MGWLTVQEDLLDHFLVEYSLPAAGISPAPHTLLSVVLRNLFVSTPLASYQFTDLASRSTAQPQVSQRRKSTVHLHLSKLMEQCTIYIA